MDEEKLPIERTLIKDEFAEIQSIPEDDSDASATDINMITATFVVDPSDGPRPDFKLKAQIKQPGGAIVGNVAQGMTTIKAEGGRLVILNKRRAPDPNVGMVLYAVHDSENPVTIRCSGIEWKRL